ncbi:MAG: hypothetical protein LBC12_00295 [Nitrososphaerota archaeon]|jgi:hypothetical protein|nr:hypothetical protein [Nitrososphaerota archaeon]
MNEEEYNRGMEDALEICLNELGQTTNIEVTVKKITLLLGAVKASKFERIKKRFDVDNISV